MLFVLRLLLIQTDIQLMATKQANILKMPLHGAGLTLHLFISLGTARVLSGLWLVRSRSSDEGLCFAGWFC